MSLRNPVQYPVRHYSHTDTDAPQMADADGAIKTIWKACLVTGYGSKESAGWTSLFEDTNRIILRRPLRTGNPPDIKIENGVINGAATHRIVSQDNPTGLDDTNELAAVNLLARDNSMRSEWHLIASDFGFIFLHGIGENGHSGATIKKQNYCYVGGTMSVKNAVSEVFFVSTESNISSAGIASPWIQGIFQPATSTNGHKYHDMRNNVSYHERYYLTVNMHEKEFDDYAAQNILINKVAILPFLCAVSDSYNNEPETTEVSIDARKMLRYVQMPHIDYKARPFYIPLDYWLL